jgi:NAD(P)H-dependent flavin oxidoreductase YrpB (nitropropane dioxygenase family)
MVEAVKPIPVIAAGGIANGRGVIAALSLGAQAVSMGTRFLCSEETQVLRAYKERVTRAKAEDTVYTLLFDVGWPNAAHRVLKNKEVAEWEAASRPETGKRLGEGSTLGTMQIAGTTIDVPRYAVFPPMPGFSGDIERMALYAGESCELINDIKPAAQIVREVVHEAEEALAQLRQ